MDEDGEISKVESKKKKKTDVNPRQIDSTDDEEEQHEAIKLKINLKKVGDF